MALFWSLMFMLSWVLIGIFAFLAGKTDKKRYLIIAVLCVLFMYYSIASLGRY